MTIQIPGTIDRKSPRSFAGAIITALSKRDNDDLTRLTVRIGETGIVRYFASRYMDPIFCTVEQEAVYKRFGEAVEVAYQTMITEITALHASKKGAL